MKIPGVMADTGMNYGPCKLILFIPKRADLIPEECLKSFVHDFTRMMARSEQITVYDVYEESKRRLNDGQSSMVQENISAAHC